MRNPTWLWLVGILVLGLFFKLCSPPAHLSHIPHVSLCKFIWMIVSGKPTRDISLALSMPHMKTPNCHMYSRFERLGWTVHVFTPQAAKAVFLNNKIFPKVQNTGWDQSLADKFLNGPNVMTHIGHRWREHRSIINPAFQNKLPIPLFGETTCKMFQVLDRDHGNTAFEADVGDLLFRWSLDILGLAIFGFDFEGLTKDTANPWTRIYKQFDTDVKKPLFALFPALDYQLRWLFPGRQTAHENFDKFKAMLHEVIKTKRAHFLKRKASSAPKPERQDLLDLMIESLDQEGTTMSDDELYSNVCIFFAAGHDTTASALSFCLYYLAKYPAFQEQARQEALAVLCPDQGHEPNHDIKPTQEQTKRMPYIHQCIKETLRMNGTVASLVHPRVATQDTVLMGTPIKKGTHVSVNIYDLHHNPSIWKDPETFLPDRFAPGGEYEQQPLSTAWLPFGYGARQCIGFKFNIAEQLVLLPMFLRKYTWRLPDNSMHQDHAITNNIVVMNPLDMRLVFERRY
ncbi:cytochrome P-450 cyp509A1 [Hesseltinella vesiculosa]|uniref:Cytochrome P-450 cyp509A1 n=1 Tax=Hesseltinella vesiculosa TaxID=101127 RepID=A0A1X2GLF5_9FUNG|nr:cytochrome P-450 cyp509A1 [Hesseltinella vesiculosa]